MPPAGTGAPYLVHRKGRSRDRGAPPRTDLPHQQPSRRPRQGRHEFPLAAGAAAPAAGLQHGVGGIKDHRSAKGLQLGQAAVIHHQGVVAEAAATFGEPELAAAGFQAGLRQLAHHLAHVPGGQELPLLHVHHLLCAGHGLSGSLKEVGLEAEEGRDLQHIHCLGGDG